MQQTAGARCGDGFRWRRGRSATTAGILGLAVGSFHLWALNLASLPPRVFLPISVGLMIAVASLHLATSAAVRSPRPIVGTILFGSAATCLWYASTRMLELAETAGLAATPLDVAACAVLVALVLVLVRHFVGWPLALVVLVFLLHPIFGDLLPGPLQTRDFSLERITGTLLTGMGMFSTPTAVVATYVVLFVYFGKIMEMTGAGNALIGLVARAVAGQAGGPAKVAVGASALFGSISGSGVADTMTTGTMTIPMMRRTGMRGEHAAAIEAVASSGSALMPPVMGAAAFLMAELLLRPYTDVILIALIPCALFYGTLFWRVHLLARREGLREDHDMSGSTTAAWRAAILLAPLLLLIAMLVIVGASPIKAASFAVALAIALHLARRWREPLRFLDELLAASWSAAFTAMPVVLAAVGAALLVGSVNLTGLGFTLTRAIEFVAGGMFLPTLIAAAGVVLLFGMGLPPTVSYILGTVIVVPVLVDVGTDVVAAHFFVFFVTALANVTPPVGMSSFAAAGLAGLPPFRVSLAGARMLGPILLVPFVFAWRPELLLQGTPLAVAVATLCTAAVLVLATVADVGYWRRLLSTSERWLALGLAASLTWALVAVR